MMKHKLEEKKSTSGEMEKQLGLLDLLFEHRLQHIDSSVIRDEASKCKFENILPYVLYSLCFTHVLYLVNVSLGAFCPPYVQLESHEILLSKEDYENIYRREDIISNLND